MATQELKPTPTEYKGCTFRSKSEAMFAFHLDKAGWHWMYESNAASDIHPWDFHISHQSYAIENLHHHHVRTVFIEYKPSKPTETYIQNLKEKIKQHFEHRISKLLLLNQGLVEFSRSQVLVDLQSEFLLVWGSPWNPAWRAPTDVEMDFDSLPDDVYLGHGYKSTTYRAIDLFQESTSRAGVHEEFKHGCMFFLGINDKITEEARAYRFDLKH